MRGRNQILRRNGVGGGSDVILLIRDDFSCFYEDYEVLCFMILLVLLRI